MTSQYTVFVHNRSTPEHPPVKEGTYTTHEAAVAVCKLLVRESLSRLTRAQMSEKELLQSYLDYGSHPHMDSGAENKAFHAESYAKTMCLKALQKPALLSSRFQEALAYAARLHNHQQRKGSTTPYIAHLLAVSSLVLESGGDEDEAIAALLHDGPEDQGGTETLSYIRDRFGDNVARIVADCSDTFEHPKPPWQERKEAYIKHLHGATASTLRVSCADKLHNLRSILRDYRSVGETVWERFSANRTQTLWYYRTLSALFAQRLPGPLSRELHLTFEALSQLLP